MKVVYSCFDSGSPAAYTGRSRLLCLSMIVGVGRWRGLKASEAVGNETVESDDQETKMAMVMGKQDSLHWFSSLLAYEF